MDRNPDPKSSSGDLTDILRALWAMPLLAKICVAVFLVGIPIASMLDEQDKKAGVQGTANEQERRDKDAQLYSYWSTTVRVDANMDSFWLPGEERVCQSYPDNKGRLALITCPASESHGSHNIPVKFWGGVDRGVVSDWKCRREKNLLDDEFVCRAIN
jgi:hypothetical protein